MYTEDMPRGGKQPGAGRPKAEYDLKQIERLASIMCTWDDIAAALGVCVRTVFRWKESDPAVNEAYERGQGNGRVSLRRAQVTLYKKGNPAMQIWLGKQWLGQRDVCPIELSGPRGDAIKVDVEELRVKLAGKLSSIASRIRPGEDLA